MPVSESTYTSFFTAPSSRSLFCARSPAFLVFCRSISNIATDTFRMRINSTPKNASSASAVTRICMVLRAIISSLKPVI